MHGAAIHRPCRTALAKSENFVWRVHRNPQARRWLCITRGSRGRERKAERARLAPANPTSERITGRWDKKLDTSTGLIEMGARQANLRK